MVVRILAIEDVLLFLDEIRRDSTQRHLLGSGGDLLRAATDAGLIEQRGQYHEFIPRMNDLREVGLVTWQPAPFDPHGNDFGNGRDFRLTAEGLRQAREIASRSPRLPTDVEELLTERGWTSVLGELREGDRQSDEGHGADAVGDYYTAVESALKYRLNEAGVVDTGGDALNRLARRAVQAGLIPANYQALFGYLDSVRSPREHGRGNAPPHPSLDEPEVLLMRNHARSLVLYLLQKR